MSRIEGLHVATVTPFDASGALDRAAYRAHVAWLFESGVDGVVPCGTTGEGPTVSAEERRILIEESLAEARPRKKLVIAGCGGNDTRKVAASVQEAAEMGVDAALVVTPYYNRPTQEGLLAHYRYVADNGGLPLLLYHVPGRTAVTFEAETIWKLLEHDRIVGLKEASGNYGFWTKLIEQFPVREKALLAGDDDAYAVMGAFGGCGAISASANVAPVQFASLWKAVRDGRWEQAFREQARLLPLVRAMFCETNPAPAKHALSAMGRMTDTLRLPLVPVRSASGQRIEAALRSLELLS